MFITCLNRQDAEVTALMEQINAVDGVGKVQLTLLTSHW